MTRRLTEREVIAVLLRQGAGIPCFRCREPLTDPKNIAREHVKERFIDKDDSADNAAFSHEVPCHHTITNGTKATSAGSSKHKAAKDKRIRTGKMAIVFRGLDKKLHEQILTTHTAMPNRKGRKLQGQGFQKRTTKFPWPKRDVGRRREATQQAETK